MIKNLIIIFLLFLRLITLISVVKLLYVTGFNFNELNSKEFIWWCLVLIFDIWLQSLSHPFREIGDGEK